MFRSTENKGFQMTFKNGVEISVQWGYGNYCSARDLKKDYLDTMKKQTHKSETVEVSIFKGKDNITVEFAKLHDVQSDGFAMGWLNSEQVVDAVNWAMNY